MDKTELPPLRALRIGMGLSQNLFWEPLGVVQSGGSRYERGRRVPEPVRKLIKLVHIDGHDLNHLSSDAYLGREARMRSERAKYRTSVTVTAEQMRRTQSEITKRALARGTALGEHARARRRR